MKLALALLTAAHLAAQALPWVDLAGPWKIARTDDSRFAQPDFDDSGWEVVNLPRAFDFSSDNPQRHFWLRRTVELPADFAVQPLYLTVGKLAENYEIYLNGQLLVRIGQFDREHSQLARPRSFALPPGATGRVSLAIRLWLHPYLGAAAWRRSADPGPYLITAAANTPQQAGPAFLRQLQALVAGDIFLGVALLTLMLILLLIYASRRTRLELLWLALYCGGIAWRRLSVVLLLHPDSTPWITPWGQAALNNALLTEFFLSVFGVRAWPLRLAGWALAVVVFTPWGYGARNTPLSEISYYVAGLALLYSLVRTSKRDLAGWLIAFAGLLMLFVFPSDPLRLRTPDGVRVIRAFLGWNAQALVATAFALSMVLVLTRRLLSDQTEKQRLAGELEAARSVQQLLVSAPDAPAGLAIEAVYYPAHEVGGDFYWTRTDPDGALLVVAGDVSGKGLRAAMVVSLLIGALRQSRERHPAALLEGLNRTVYGQLGGGFVTCCGVRLGTDGRVVVANAGHLAPYVDGQPMETPAGLPLGIDEGARYEEAEGVLRLGSALTLLSDGVVEAEAAGGELFGFERTRAISTQSAQQIAAAARSWGQNDDITVVTVRRVS